MHGHEPKLDRSDVVRDIGMLAIPVGITLSRVGLDFAMGVASNEAIASYYNHSNEFVIFGHTHAACIMHNYANTGCFLRSAMQIVLSIEATVIRLWQRRSYDK